MFLGTAEMREEEFRMLPRDETGMFDMPSVY